MTHTRQSGSADESRFLSLTAKTASLYQDSTRIEASAKIDEFCRKYGFFYLEDPLIDTDLTMRAFHEAKDYFNLPLAIKASSLAVPNSHFLGYRPLGSEASILGDQKEYCEQFKIGYIPLENGQSRSSVTEHLKHEIFSLNGVLDYWNAMQVLSNRLLDVFGELLGFEESYFQQHTSQPLHQLGLNYYPSRKIDSNTHGQSISLQDHVDLDLFTVISQEVAGLEVKIDGNDYALVPPKPGSLLVLLGEYMHLWSGGRYVAPLHRVISRESKDRTSLIYKHRPNHNAIIDVPLVCSNTGETKYQHYHTGRTYNKKIYRIMGQDLPTELG